MEIDKLKMYCSAPGHQDSNLQDGFICIEKNCQFKSRFICLICATENQLQKEINRQDHLQMHKKSVIPVHQLLNNTYKGNWPPEEFIGKEYKILLDMNKIKESEIHSEFLNILTLYFDEFQKRINKEIEKIKKKVIQDQKENFIQCLNMTKQSQIIKDFLDFEGIKRQLEKFFLYKIPEQEFNQTINQIILEKEDNFLNNPETKQLIAKQQELLQLSKSELKIFEFLENEI